MNDLQINCVIGIDPGRAGGIAVFIRKHKPFVTTVKMPKDIAELRDFFEYYAENYKTIVFLEKLSVRPDDVMSEGDKPNLGKLYRIQKLMANFEQLKAVIESVGIPFVLVHPMSWQTKLKLRMRGRKEDKRLRKRRYVEAAQCFFPEVRATLWSADALLIMQFGRWALVNDLKWVEANLPEREYEKLFNRRNFYTLSNNLI